MKKTMLVLLAGMVSAAAMAGPVRFHLEFAPLGGVSSPNAKVDIRKTTGTTTQIYEMDGGGAYLGTLQVGVEIDTKIGYVDILGGGGMMVLPTPPGSDATTGSTFMGDIGYRFKLNRSGTVTIGPFIGIFAPQDTEMEVEDDLSAVDDDMDTFDMKASGGMQGGLKFTAGGEHVAFLLKVGYTSFEYELEADDDPNWVISYGGDDAIDMSGFFAQLGLTAQF